MENTKCFTMKPISIYVCMLFCFITSNKCEAQLTAIFSAGTTSGCSPIVVNFSDQSTGNPTEWRWDLGNGTLSTLQNPSATYFNAGFYTVKLWIKSGNRIDSVTRTNYIHVFNSPAVDFSAANTIGCTPLAVNFTDHSSIDGGSIISRQWDFGDGILSVEQNPQHLYTLPGNFNVTLKVISVDGCASNLRRSSYIINNRVVAAFKNWGFSICQPNKIVFQNESAGDGNLIYNWHFGDGTSSSESTPVHTYAAAGIYTVKLLVRNELGCIDSISKNLTVSARLIAAFTSDNTVSCVAPATINFSNQTTGNNTYYWDFGDSTSSTLMNPSHQYQDTGVYSVKLSVKSSNGCTDSLFIRNYIKIQKTYVNLLALPDSGCIPFTKYFVADVYASDSITDYSWNFGNGILLSGQSPVHTFNTAGNYSLSLVTTSSSGCRDTILLPNAIRTGHKPTARFSADITNACASTTISFTDLSIGNITSWQWDFGDQGISADQNPTHVYADTGWMTVQLTVSAGGCSDVAIYTSYIYIKPVVAKFRAIMQCDSPYKRIFNNFSIGAMRWQWNFGDGTISNEFSPVHIFPHTGIFSVTLRTWNDSTGCTYSYTRSIKITDITVDFFATDTTVCKGDSVFFNANSNPEIVRYLWNFGDGVDFSTVEASVVHVYKNPGNYLTRLTVKDSLGCITTLSKDNYIEVLSPLAKFGSSVYDVCLNTPVAFIDSSVVASSLSPISKWEWNYGDGKSDTLFSPPFSHVYVNPGIYRPLLKVTDSMGCSDTFRLVKRISAGKIFPAFYISDSIACPGYSLKFTCPYSLSGVVYRWDFGDGQTSSSQIPFHSYAREGIYTVKLYVSKVNSCTDSSIMINAVRIKQTRADFTLTDSFSTCPPLLVGFTGNSVSALGQYWNFGDSTYTDIANPSHYYTYPGEYNVMLIAKGRGNCADTMRKKIIINGPKGTITSNKRFSCKPYNYSFIAHTENAISYVWDYDDGVIENGTDSMVSHLYIDSGVFIPKIILKDADGCRVPVLSKDTLSNIFINPYFTLSDSTLCTKQTIPFVHSSSSNDPITGVVWNFGNSVFSTMDSASHQYNLTGDFYPSLQVTTAAGCVNSFQSAVAVKVLPSPAVTMLTTGSGCAPLDVLFNAVTTDADSSFMNWKWDMGNGDTSVLQNPPVKTYNNAGDYAVSLSAINKEGCGAIWQQVIKVYPAPATAISGDTALCRGGNTSLHASGAERYKWFPGSGFSCDTCNNVIIQPLINTQYILTGSSDSGCSSNDTFNVIVHQPIQLQYRQSADICKGESKNLEVSGASFYKWSPSYGLNSIVSASPLANPDTTVQYVVVGSDSQGCFSDTGQIKVNVHQFPQVKASEDKTITAGTPVSLEAIYSADVTDVYWFPNDNLSRYDLNSVIVKPIENTEYTVKVKNRAGCSASDRVTVFVTCNKNNVFLPTLFSPNNDGVNDVFYPRGTGLLKIKNLRIYNRWGEAVFEKQSFNANDPAAGWDGTFRGSKLMSDVFVYVIDLVCENSSFLSLKGNVSLVQ